MASDKQAGWPARVWAALSGGIVTVVGAALMGGGAWLIFLTGSPYYLLAGAGVVATGVLLVRRHPFAGLVYAAVLAATLGWGLWEGGYSFWPLLPRIFAPAVLGLFILLVIPTAPRGLVRNNAGLATGLVVFACLATLGSTVPQTFVAGQTDTPAQVRDGAPSAQATSDWRYYGRDPGGSRYAPVDQINRENVDELKVAWTFRTGEVKHRGSEDQNTPMQMGDTLYLCTPTNVVIAVNADTGKERWRHDPKVTRSYWNRCRGVGYWDGTQPKVALVGTVPTLVATTAKPAPPKLPGNVAVKSAMVPAPPSPLCKRRIISTTISADLYALDADTGAPCPGFGKGGKVDLTTGIGPIKKSFYFQTSTPTVIGDKVIIGGWVADNQEIAEPAGVVRAFSVITGELVWAWDLGNPAISTVPPPGQTYTRGTPNVWSTPAFDPDLGLVYLPTGNSTPDYWGSHRSGQSEIYSSSVVALDIATGKERWKFQTVHHDLWDYDVPSQPMLIDFPIAGGTALALVQLTKRGQVFGEPASP